MPASRLQFANNLPVVEDVHRAVGEVGDGGGRVDAEVAIEIGEEVGRRVRRDD